MAGDPVVLEYGNGLQAKNRGVRSISTFVQPVTNEERVVSHASPKLLSLDVKCSSSRNPERTHAKQRVVCQKVYLLPKPVHASFASLCVLPWDYLLLHGTVSQPLSILQLFH